MAFMNSCLCCSLLSGSIIIGIAAAFLYGVAFAIELWMIIETDVSLSVPAYILTIGYLLMFLLSLAMILSLRTKWSKVLLAWLLMMVIYIFPEAGLVLFMSIYHWEGETYGIIEISMWLVRIFFNLCGIVCVQSLWCAWREEKSIFRSLHELSINTGDIAAGGGSGLAGQHKLRHSFRYNTSNSQIHNGHYNLGYGYHNPAFSTSINHLSGTALSVTKYNQKNIKRSVSSASHFVTASRLSMPDLSSINNNNSMVFTRQLKQGLSRNEFNPGGVHKTLSQYDLPSFGLDPDAPIFIQQGYGPGGLPLNIYRGNSRRDHLMSEGLETYRPRSLGNLMREDSVSMLSERFNTGTGGGGMMEYDTQSLDRRRMHPMHGQHLGGRGHLNIGYIGETYLSETETGGFQSFGGSLGSKQSLGQISGVSDSPEKYRDIAL